MHPAYLAGIVDGEGCIQLRRNKPRKSGGITPLPSVIVRMTHRETVMRLADEFEANSFYERESAPGHKRTFSAEWRGVRAAALLAIVRPYLITKAAQADAVLRWAEVKPLTRGRPRIEQMEARIAVIEEMEALVSVVRTANKRGTR